MEGSSWNLTQGEGKVVQLRETENGLVVVSEFGKVFTGEESEAIARMIVSASKSGDDVKVASLMSKASRPYYSPFLNRIPSPGFVYVVTDGELHKIGISKDVNKRIKSLQNANGREVNLCCAYWVGDAPVIEADIHAKYREHRQKGEWFDLNESQVREIAEMLEALS